VSNFDLVLFGATGFTGRLVAEYLHAHGGGARWAIAGRDRGKLEKLRGELGAPELPVLIADSADPAALKAIAGQTKAICSTVGPYAKYGTPLVEQCVEAGIGYCDLTGEPHWIREMIDRFHSRAGETGARIVHCCGFDSIPSDLGALMVADHLEKKHGQKAARINMRVAGLRGGFSGGTVASLFGLLRAAKDKKVRRVLGDPYSLIPEEAERGRDKNEPFKPEKDPDRGRWTAPFLMAAVNTKIVRRSAAMLGRSFAYEEKMELGRGPRGFFRASTVAFGMAAVIGTAALPGFGALYEKLAPKPGEGPAKEDRERGYFRFEFFGEGDGVPPARAFGTVSAQGDPGYAATSRILGEAALCLALDPLPSRGGVLTPAVAMGFTLIERLRRAGLVFDVEDSRPPRT
jgi:short subunit dehydrogenase-like uncharacterized protein